MTKFGSLCFCFWFFFFWCLDVVNAVKKNLKNHFLLDEDGSCRTFRVKGLVPLFGTNQCLTACSAAPCDVHG